jgi:hydrogenase/urease accessory protein HupE
MRNVVLAFGLFAFGTLFNAAGSPILRVAGMLCLFAGVWYAFRGIEELGK